MKLDRFQTMLLALVAVVALVHLVTLLATPASALDAKVGSDSAAVAVTTSADGAHVYVCDGRRCYASHDAGATFSKMKVE